MSVIMTTPRFLMIAIFLELAILTTLITAPFFNNTFSVFVNGLTTPPFVARQDLLIFNKLAPHLTHDAIVTILAQKRVMQIFVSLFMLIHGATLYIFGHFIAYFLTQRIYYTLYILLAVMFFPTLFMIYIIEDWVKISSRGIYIGPYPLSVWSVAAIVPSVVISVCVPLCVWYLFSRLFGRNK